MRIPVLRNGDMIVDPDFLSSESPIPITGEKLDYIGEGETPGLESIAAEFNRLTGINEITKPYTTDGEMAASIHQHLKLSRFEASHHQFWHVLTVLKCQKYVIWRWPGYGINGIPRNRYLGPWYNNALGRLWWWAEFTHDPDNNEARYRSTIRAAASQEFMRDTIENLLCGNSNLVKALCDVCFPAEGGQLKDKEIREIIKRINALLVTTTIDLLNENEVKSLVENVYKHIEEQQEVT